ncbi:Arginine repressor [Mannheimia haemolytica]|nr:Arginine repressor [Mannheimia haemolytica]
MGKAEGILGTIAGDDTIFITPVRNVQIEKLVKNVTQLFETSL